MKSLTVIVFIIYRSVICINAADERCNTVQENYYAASQLHETKSQAHQILTDANFTVIEGDSDFDQFVPVSENEYDERTKRSHILLKTAYLLKQNLPNHGTNEEFLDQLLELNHCLPQYSTPSCTREENTEYRPIDGKLAACCRSAGKSFEAYARLEKPNYSDGLYDMPIAKSGLPLPSPRIIINEVVRKLLRHFVNLRENLNMIHMFQGQYIAHDMGSRVNRQVQGANIRCCSSTNQMLSQESLHPSCIPIKIFPGDPDYADTFPEGACLSIIRSDIVAQDLNQMCPADQMNTVTSSVDHSNIYGSLPTVTAQVRSFVAGKLLMGPENILAKAANGRFFTGDARFIQTPHLALSHSLWVRWHNVIAENLAKVNPQWKDEKLFQEARRINIAFYQNIIYEEYLVGYLHPRIRSMLDLPIPADICDDATYNEHAAAFFRVIHGFIPSTLKTGLDTSDTIQNLLLNMAPLINDYDGMVRGMLMQPYNLKDYASGLMHHLFGSPGADLPGLDLQRGRDHGMPPYYKFLEKWTKTRISTWKHLKPYMSKTNLELLEKNYANVQDVDLIIGLLLETPMDGTYLGPTTQIFIVYQFIQMRDKDPYFYPKLTSPNPFSLRQIREIKKATTNTLICETTGVKRVPRKPSVAPRDANLDPDFNPDFIDCKYVPSINYYVFEEKYSSGGGLLEKLPVVGKIIDKLTPN